MIRGGGGDRGLLGMGGGGQRSAAHFVFDLNSFSFFAPTSRGTEECVLCVSARRNVCAKKERVSLSGDSPNVR